MPSHGPQFATGVIVKITDDKPLPARKFIKVTTQKRDGCLSNRSSSQVRCVWQDALSRVSPVAYIDILEGDAEGHVRFHSPEDARAVSDARAALQKDFGWKLEIISGECSSSRRPARGDVVVELCSRHRRPRAALLAEDPRGPTGQAESAAGEETWCREGEIVVKLGNVKHVDVLG